MKKTVHYFIISLLGIVIWSCSAEIDNHNQPSDTRYIRVNGYPKAFSEVDVATRSAKDEFETKLSSLYMLIFDANGDLVGPAQFAPTGIPTFIIDTHQPPFSTHDQTAIKQCDIFLVGNLNSGDLNHVQHLDDLLNFEVEASTIHPDTDPACKGLVMIGKTENKIDLSEARPAGSNNIQEISMVSLYAKVVVDLRIEPDQHIPGNDQSFRMLSWEVVNAPRYATLGAPDATTETSPSHADKLTPGISGVYSGSNPVGVSQSLYYTFYMLEHKRNKVNQVTYPEGIAETAKQRFKPRFVNENTDATYMEIVGVYTDHQGISHTATYKLYLGANAIDDFYILRDNQYNNNITIRGVTSNDGFSDASVSFDARVTVNSGPIVITVKRDTQLDCHYEVRPLDIHVAQGYTVNVEVESAARSWVGLDRETVNVEGKVVKRDYFTTTLIGDLSDSYGPFTSDFRIWAYFDENATTSDRTGRIIFTCTEDATGEQTVINYTFLQKGLFEVNYNGNTYYIEFHEEYLHNFDPNDPFNNTTDGMFWGLEGMQLSKDYDAFRFNGILADDVTAGIKRQLGNYTYDFYTPLDIDKIGTNGVTINTRAGHAFTSKIVSQAGIGPLKLTETAKSAVEYCYNKNKRNASGIVSDIKWYLPAIDEIEDIVMGAYGTFSDFQNKYYWSSQPAYNFYAYHYAGWFGANPGDGNFFNDNVNNAKATKVVYKNAGFDTEDSGMSSALKEYRFVRKFPSTNIVWDTPPDRELEQPTYAPGYQSRNNINRIRCVYKR